MPIDNDRSRRRMLHQVLAASLGAALGDAAIGAPEDQGYPRKPIRLVPFGAPGAPIDTVARIYGERLQARWGQPVIVEAKPGASGILAADAVAKAAPDGYTLMVTLALTHTTVPMLMKRVPYDPIKDFQPLTQIATGGPMLIVPVRNPSTDLKSFVAWARQQPRVTYGTWGNGSYVHIMGEQFKRVTGAPLDHVPYKSESGAHIDMFGGQLDMAWANPATAKTLLQDGKIRVLGVTGSRRLSTLPQVPTFTEQGFPGFELDSWVGFFAPARLPPALIDKISSALRELTHNEEVARKLSDMGLDPLANAPDQFAANLKADIPRYAELIQTNHITID